MPIEIIGILSILFTKNAPNHNIEYNDTIIAALQKH